MKAHRWSLIVSSLVLTILCATTPALEQMSTVLGQDSRSLVADRDADIYKLVFPTGPTEEFGEQLNKAGEQGYDLVSVMYRWQRLSGHSYYRAPVGILKLDSVPHEYAWFKTNTKSHFTIGGFEQQYEELSKRGFHLVDFLVEVNCATTNLEGDCRFDFDRLFLLEREKGVEKNQRFIVARSIPERKLKMGAELTEQIKANLAGRFYPSNVF